MGIIITITIIIALAGGILSGVVAAAKNRDAFAWGFTGALFPVLGLIAIAGMPTARRKKQTYTVLNDAPKRVIVKSGV